MLDGSTEFNEATQRYISNIFSSFEVSRISALMFLSDEELDSVYEEIARCTDEFLVHVVEKIVKELNKGRATGFERQIANYAKEGDKKLAALLIEMNFSLKSMQERLDERQNIRTSKAIDGDKP